MRIGIRRPAWPNLTIFVPTTSDMELIIASNNRGKIAEIEAMMPGHTIRTMRDIGFDKTIDEPYDTFRENAWIKAHTVHEFCSLPVLADDSGLCVAALDGRPGVFSARFAGPGATDGDNNQKLLHALKGVANRDAHYIAVLCLMIGGEAQYFEGRCDGAIADAARGEGGFGYDPLFIPNGYDRTFGEIDAATKSRISHRARALEALRASGLLAGQ